MNIVSLLHVAGGTCVCVRARAPVCVCNLSTMCLICLKMCITMCRLCDALSSLGNK